MIPLRDTIPSRTFPYMTIMLIIINGVIFLFEMSLGKNLNDFVNIFGVIPERYFNLAYISEVSPVIRYLPFFSSIFLHGGWFHVLWNMWFLWIFGDNVEDHFGHFKFFLFYMFCGVIAGLAHTYMNPLSPVPTIGASGAIAGVMGAYIVLYPHAKVLTLIPIFFIFCHWYVDHFFSVSRKKETILIILIKILKLLLPKKTYLIEFTLFIFT